MRLVVMLAFALAFFLCLFIGPPGFLGILGLALLARPHGGRGCAFWGWLLLSIALVLAVLPSFGVHINYQRLLFP